MDDVATTNLRGVDLAECCRRLGISLSTGKRLIALGTFPIPELPQLTTGTRHVQRRYSTYSIDLYLREAPTESVRSERARARLRERLRMVSR